MEAKRTQLVSHKTTTTSVIINCVSLVILFSIVAFVLLLTGTILFFNSLIMSLTEITCTLIACLVKHFLSLDALVFLFAGLGLFYISIVLFLSLQSLYRHILSSLSYRVRKVMHWRKPLTFQYSIIVIYYRKLIIWL